MRVIFLGTNGWYDTETGNTVSTLIETKKEYIILDAGNGLYKIDRYIKGKKPIYLFLSHFHLDHIIGLHILYKFKFSQGIKLYGPPGVKKILSTIINQPYSLPFKKLRTQIKIHQLGEKLPFQLEFCKLLHASECYGYRFYLENKIIAYCTDTGICENLYFLARNADLLITECSFKPGEKDKTGWPHLNPKDAALVARNSRAKKLALTHFDASRYQTLGERQIAQKQAQKIFKNAIAARDGQEIIL